MSSSITKVSIPGRRGESPMSLGGSHAQEAQRAWRAQIQRIEKAERSAEAEGSSIRVR